MITGFILSLLGAAVIGRAAPVECRFHATSPPAAWEGACGREFGRAAIMKLAPAKAIASGRWQKDVDPSAVWAGDMTVRSDTTAIELELYDGGAGVLRTEYGWYPVSAFHAAGESMTFQIETARPVPPNDLDREIVRRADALLSSASVWNRADDRKCPAAATTWSIYCALIRATLDVTGASHHRRPAMELVRQLVDERTAGRDYSHRLMDYNNDATTTLADVHRLFVDALARMSAAQPSP